MGRNFNRFLILTLLLTLVSVFSASAILVTITNQFRIAIHDVAGTTSGLPAEGYGTLGNANLTNITVSRPYITFNVSTFNATSVNVTLFVASQGGTIGVAVFPPNNVTVALNDTATTIYFNSSLFDGYYTWWLNVSNFSIDSGVYNLSNKTDYYALVIDKTAPNITLDATTTNSGSSQSQIGIGINVTTNDSLPGGRAVAGGFVSFYLRNQSGVLNWSIRPRGIFASNLIASNNLTFSLPGVGLIFSDGEYFFNVSVNDSLGNTAWSAERSLVMDTVNPVITISSSGGSTINRLQPITLTCSVVDLHPANLTMTVEPVGGDAGTCSGLNNVGTCSFDFKPTIAGTRTVTCNAFDRVARTVISTYQLEVLQDNPGSSGGSSGGGGGGSSQSTTASLTANQPFTYSVNNLDIGVDKVVLTTSQSSDVKLTVTSMNDKPSGALEPGVNVYKYFSVDKENLEDSSLSEARLTFTVSKDWLMTNNGNVADVLLQRLHNDVWETYTPTKVGETDTHYKFEVTVPGFSTFAVGLKLAGVTESGSDQGSTTTTDEAIQQTPESTKVMPIVLVLLVLVVVVGLVWYFVGRKKK